MKEATGEANLTVITIILIGTILPVFYFVIPRILGGIKDKACCVSNNGTVVSGMCQITSGKKKNGNTYTNRTTNYTLRNFNNYCK